MKLDGIRQVAKICNYTDLDSVRAKAESHRIDGIVWDGKTVHLDVADGERGSCLKAIELGRVFAPGKRGSCQTRDVNGRVELPSQRNQAAHMIGVLMGDQDGIHAVALLINSGKTREKIALTQAGVHQDTGTLGSDEGRVSRTAAGEHTNFDDDTPPCSLWH